MKDLLAAFTFFTRLPFWRLCNIPSDHFKHIVPHWPFVGWLTGGSMACIFWLSGQLFTPLTAVLLTFSGRLLLTGALHEDGLADFLDGMGGGKTKERILAIMKDSSIGSYGVLGLILYFALWITSVHTISTHYPLYITCILLFTGDIWSKWSASQLINLLPYVRKASESKSKLIYERMSFPRFLTGLTGVILPVVQILIFTNVFEKAGMIILIAGLAPVITAALLAGYMKRRIRGYTGDCCGATFLLCELLYFITFNGLWKFI
ncbi:MAG: adenosylcobinamide-GDP ribazoletransferase [Tannerella sp.]|jgi:adenosylcobinamide-GDP ribazoletransferase|nr:adenosylcobinamide-GDP ribazoletransferase [Tannerella sp.]